MLSDWISMEHYRLHVVENLPDSHLKQATISAIHSSLARLGQDPHSLAGSAECLICSSRPKPVLKLGDRKVHAAGLALVVGHADHPGTNHQGSNVPDGNHAHPRTAAHASGR